MSRLKFLKNSVNFMLLLLLLAFAYVFLRGILYSKNSSTVDKLKPFEQLQQGETKLLRYQGEMVWASSLTGLKKQLDSHTGFVNQQGCYQAAEICVLSAQTNRDGVLLAFSRQAPAGLPVGVPWHGGFINPGTGAAYDILGRQYLYNKQQVDLTVIKLD